MRKAAAVVVAVAVCSPLASAAPGDLDRTWGTGGITRTPLEPLAQRRVGGLAVTVTHTGVLVDGLAGYPDFPRSFVVRYTKRGRLDRTFGTAGVVRFLDGDGAESVAVALPDGKVVLTGEPLRRLDRRGRLDHTFGVRGRVRLRVGGCRYYAKAALRQPDGKLVLELAPCGFTNNTYALMRLHPDGRIDRTFGRSGMAAALVGVRWGLTASSALSRQPDGKLIVAGSAQRSDGDVVALVRFRSDGQLDRGFGNGGIVFTRWDGPHVDSVFVLPDGKLLLAGCRERLTGYAPVEPLIVRYLQDGSLDPSWGAGGIRSYHDLDVARAGCPDFAMTYQRKVLILGSRLWRSRLWRLNSDGGVDSSFGQRGSIASPGSAIGVQRDGKIVLAGATRIGRNRLGITVRRYHGG